jgi:protein-disulfide isomerase
MTVLPTPITDRDHVVGAISAELVLIELGDYQCPYCRTADDVVEELRDRFGAHLRVVFRHFPKSDLHDRAVIAAEAAEAAGSQGRFWDMHRLLLENQPAFELRELQGYAARLGLDLDRFTDDVRSHIHIPKIREDFVGGVRGGVTSTPGFYINGVRYDGPTDALSLATGLELARVRTHRAPAHDQIRR